jgi:ribosomal protein S18 acetylase RimI-like enzyme
MCIRDRVWGGPSISYPIELKVLIEEIGFKENNSYIYRVNEKIVGFGQVVDKDKNVRHLARIITNPESRRSGYGYELCNYLISIASERGGMITLNVYRNNRAAVTLYNRLGFTENKEKSNNEVIFMSKT